eukprot:1887289-Ditylum_brightwellii.AAC.1
MQIHIHSIICMEIRGHYWGPLQAKHGRQMLMNKGKSNNQNDKHPCNGFWREWYLLIFSLGLDNESERKVHDWDKPDNEEKEYDKEEEQYKRQRGMILENASWRRRRNKRWS